MTTLSHGQYVRLASWTHSVASVGTLAGMELSPESVAMCRQRGDAECWTVYAGASITAGKAFYERDRERFASAIVIADGQTVRIESYCYRVRVIAGNAGQSPRNSDPIHFDLLEFAVVHRDHDLFAVVRVDARTHKIIDDMRGGFASRVDAETYLETLES